MTIVYFTAPWCVPCKVFGPVMENIGDDYKVIKIDIDEDMEAAAQSMVLSVPTILILNDEKSEIGRFSGARTENWVRDFIKETEKVYGKDTSGSVA